MTESNPSPDLTTPASTVAQGQDIVGCNQAGLRANAAPYQTILEDLTEVICRFKADGTIIFVNEVYCRLFGKMSQELVGRKWQPRAAAEDVPMIEAQLRTLSPTNPVVVVENRVYSGSGEMRWMQFVNHGFFDAAGQLVETQAVGRDITERKRLQEMLNESEERYRSLATSSMDAVLLTTPDGHILTANEEACRMFGRSEQELIQVGRSGVIDSSDPRLPRALEERARMGRFCGELMLVRKDGTKFTSEVSSATFTDGHGRLRTNVTIRDITGRKQAEERIRRLAREFLIMREKERQQVSSALHHDVGSLAVGISAHLDVIEEDIRSGKPGDALKWMKRTRKLFGESVVRLKGLATQLRPPELDLLGLPAALRQYFSQATECGDTRIHFRETLGRRRMAGDSATTLFRIAQEALTNAISHGNAKRVDVDLQASKKEVRLTIRDNGKGFDPSVLGARETSRIGLRVMQEMAVCAGGVCGIDSKPGKGTTVRVSLPLKTAALGPGNVTTPKETAGRGKTFRSVGRGPRREKGSLA